MMEDRPAVLMIPIEKEEWDFWKKYMEGYEDGETYKDNTEMLSDSIGVMANMAFKNGLFELGYRPKKKNKKKSKSSAR